MNVRKHARIGIVHFMAFPEVMKGEGPVLETVRCILDDDYFDAVEVTRIADAQVAREAARLIAQAHVTVAFGAQLVLLGGRLNLCAADPAAQRRTVESVAACFDQAALLGAVGVAVLCGAADGGQEQDARQRLIESLIELSRKAAAYSMKLALEVFDDAVKKRSLVGKAAVAQAVGEAVRRECTNFGLMHDLSHMPLLGESPMEALAPVHHLLIHMHMGNCVRDPADAPGYGDQHPRFGIPHGCNDVPELAAFLKALYEVGYLGGPERRILSFEVKPLPDEDSALVIANAKRTLNEAISRLGFDAMPVRAEEGVTMVGLDRLFRESDVVSLHCPLTAENKGMVNAARLATMKPTAFLINTSRGPLVDAAALADALNSDRLAGAGLDVLEVEPPPATNPLLSAKNCYITPHIAWATREARARLMEVTVANVKAFLAGPPQNTVSA